MAQIGEEREENVELSLQTFLNTNYTLTAIRWPGVVFEESKFSEWIVPVLLEATGRYHRQVASGRLGKTVPFIYNIQAIVKRTFLENGNAMRGRRIADTLLYLFREPKSIDVRDYVAGGSPPALIGSMQCFDTDSISLGLDQETGVYMWAVSCTMFYTLQWEG